MPQEIIEILNHVTGHSCKTIAALLIHNVSDNFYLSPEKSNPIKWVMPINIRSNNNKYRHGLQICPSCLKSDRKTPYYRKIWRLGFFTCCLTHKTEFIDSCPVCKMPINPRKHYKPSGCITYSPEHFTLCHHCGFDLKLVKPSLSGYDELQINKFHYQLYKTGYGTIGSLHFNYSNLYFDGIRRLLSAMLCNRKAKKLSTYLFQKYSHLWANHTKVEKKHIEPYFLDLSLRRGAIILLYRYLKDWPGTFLRDCKKSVITFNHLIEGHLHYPYWLYDLLRKELLAISYKPTHTEIISAAHILEKRNHSKPSLSELRRFMQIGVSYKPKNLSTINHISYSQYNKIVKFMLDLISSKKSNPSDNFLLSRYLVCFMLCVEGHLSAKKISNLSSPSFHTEHSIIL